MGENLVNILSGEVSHDKLLATDFRWNVFCAAVASFKSESLIKPFPAQFIIDGVKDLDSLRSAAHSFPRFEELAAQSARLTDAQKELYSWLTSSSKYTLSALDVAEIVKLRELTGEHIPISAPDYIFEVKHNEQQDTAFNSRKKDHRLLYAYHGSKCENFYSILTHGLHSHMNKTSLFGEGTYLSVEPTVALGFSPWGHTGWKNSNIGSDISIIALCEIINDNKSVKISDSATAGGRRAPNSQAGDIPDKYIVVTNNDMVRLKYLLVYSRAPPAINMGQAMKRKVVARRNRIVDFLHRHGHILSIAFYIFLLILIALAGSKQFWIKFKHFYEEYFDHLDPWSILSTAG